MYFIGIDGGGTKTDFLISDQTGKTLGSIRAGSLSYKHIGREECMQIIENYLHTLVERIQLGKEAEFYTCLALPNYGESKEHDRYFQVETKRLSRFHIQIVNDAQAGWAGSLGLSAGVNLVAGTGAIAYGRNEAGLSERAGGWSDIFSDEGSCNWLGRATLELFAKEADGRLKKSWLYTVIREHFELNEDFEIIDIFETQYANSRKKTAQLQRLLLEAAVKGDEYAVLQYEKAAYELSLTALTVAEKLKFENEVRISYSGGLFHAGEIIMAPFRQYLEESGREYVLQKPLFTPVKGAVLLAAEYWGGEATSTRIMDTWQ